MHQGALKNAIIDENVRGICSLHLIGMQMHALETPPMTKKFQLKNIRKLENEITAIIAYCLPRGPFKKNSK